MTISVIVPTIDSRAEWLAKCIASYKETTPDAQIIVVKNKPTCGEAWIAGAAKATGDYLHFTADDLVALPGWWEAAVAVADSGSIPAANVLTRQLVSGEWYDQMDVTSQIRDGRHVPNVLVPFFSRPIFERAEWLLPIHYGSDDWVTFLADAVGVPAPFTSGFMFGHGAAPEGRLHDSRRHDIPLLIERMEQFGGAPQVYRNWLPILAATAPSPARVSAEPGAPVEVRAGGGPIGEGYYWNGPVVNQQLDPVAPPVESTEARVEPEASSKEAGARLGELNEFGVMRR